MMSDSIFRRVIRVSKLVEGNQVFVDGKGENKRTCTNYRVITLVCGHTLIRPPDTDIKIADEEVCGVCCEADLDAWKKTCDAALAAVAAAGVAK